MFRENRELFKKLSIVADIIILAISFIAAYYLRGWIGKNFQWTIFPSMKILREYPVSLNTYFPILVASIIFWILGLYFNGMYVEIRTRSLSKIFIIVLQGSLFYLFGLGSLIFLFNIKFVGRMVIAFFIIIGLIAIVIEKKIILFGLGYIRKKGLNHRRIVIVGTGKRAAGIIQRINEHPEWGFKILGAIDDEPGRGISSIAGVNVIGKVDSISDILKKEAVDEVIIIVPRSRLNHVEKTVLACEIVGVRVLIAMNLFNLEIARAHHTDLDGIPFLSIDSNVLNTRHMIIKRFMDIVLSLIAIVMTIPISLFAAIAIKIDSRGPVIFKQRRAGLNSRNFVLLKFRTMYVGSEALRAGMGAKNELDGPTFKMKKDPRVTAVGHILRKLSIDELPQFFNILAGRMSLVGPRALATYEVEKFDLWQRRRLSMRPGLTGLWQVKGRNNVDFINWMKLDLEYVDHWSLWLDLKILAWTIPAVLFGRGAY
jgi:exopolysaccharide biosynthesis polyprenyl glycosylphosphotransferase